MKLPDSQITSFAKKHLSLFYNEDNVHLHQITQYYYSHINNNALRVNDEIFKDLVAFNLEQQKLLPSSYYRKQFNEEGRLVLIEIAEDVEKHDNIIRLGRNLSLFDINFLRKEKIYAKLKYSRSPQYDIVSGGLAAIFSGFLGFLICEKFGLELLDSGDFYTAFMYAVFIVFSVRPLVRVVNGFNKDKTYTPTYNILSPQPLLNFYTNLIKLIFKLFK